MSHSPRTPGPRPYGGSMLSPNPLAALFQSLNPKPIKVAGAFGKARPVPPAKGAPAAPPPAPECREIDPGSVWDDAP